MSRKFLVTSTRVTAEKVRSEILRLDPEAGIAYRRENKTLLCVVTDKMSELTLEAIDGVAHVVPTEAIGFK